MASLAYYRRVIGAYLGGGTSQLTFWHGVPEVNEAAFGGNRRQFYMRFERKARYGGPFDGDGIPLLDYRGSVGRQYNPIAIAQHGLGCFNLFDATGNPDWEERYLRAADWLVGNLQPNAAGVPVWVHRFDWEYFRLLKAPWYSGLAQGQGIALLVRAYRHTGDAVYLKAAEDAFPALVTPIAEGGVLHVDDRGYWWIEEYITDPPTHILNGFLWALWGVRDFRDLTGDPRARELWDESLRTLEANLSRFGRGFWSTYDLAPTRLPNLASPFYHSLHLVQLDIMVRLTGMRVFAETLRTWQGYARRRACRSAAFMGKCLFKAVYF